MVQIDAAKDLAAMFNPPEGERYSGMRYGQGVILTWNPATFENEVSFRGLTLTNLPILGKIDGLSLTAGDVVGLMGWAPNGGFGSWWILGELGVPPLAEPVAVEGGANFVVRDGGSVIIEDGSGGPQVRLGALTSEPGEFGLEQLVGSNFVPLAALAGGAQVDVASGAVSESVGADGDSGFVSKSGGPSVTFTTYTGKWALVLVATLQTPSNQGTAMLGYVASGAQSINASINRAALGRVPVSGTGSGAGSYSQVFINVHTGSPGDVTVSARYRLDAVTSLTSACSWRNRAMVIIPY